MGWFGFGFGELVFGDRKVIEMSGRGGFIVRWGYLDCVVRWEEGGFYRI